MAYVTNWPYQLWVFGWMKLEKCEMVYSRVHILTDVFFIVSGEESWPILNWVFWIILSVRYSLLHLLKLEYDILKLKNDIL